MEASFLLHLPSAGPNILSDVEDLDGVELVVLVETTEDCNCLVVF
jgi:hypothetical protein